MERFPDEIVERLAETREIDIETTGRRSGLRRRTTTWVVVDDGVPYVRSEFGDAGQWYRNARAEPRLGIILDGRRLEATATLVTDPAQWRRVSDGFRTKYGRSSAVAEMVDPAVEPMTLAVSPAA
jgi:deazaflavin-dependent oxidoreductase (nitroreductase family)